MATTLEPDDEMLQDIMFKFIYNLGQEYKSNPVQLMFQIERAWWYYEDTVRAQKKNYRTYKNYNLFTVMLAARVPYLQALLGDTQEALEQYRTYKQKIPVFGAILLDPEMERVLLVLEETGYDIEPLINPDNYIRAVDAHGKEAKLFIVVGVNPETTAFAPQMAGEIGGYAWHWVRELPSSKEDANQVYRITREGNMDSKTKFFMVATFMSQLKRWVRARRKALGLPPPSWDQQPNQQPNQQAGLPVATSSATATPEVQPAPNRAPLSLAGLKERPAPRAAAITTTAVPTPQETDLHAVARALAMATLTRGGGKEAGMRAGAGAQAASGTPPPPPTAVSYPPGNLVMSSAFRFDVGAIMRCLPT